MIKKNEPLSMAEAMEYSKNSKDEGKEIQGFIKKFTKLKAKEAKEIRKKIKNLEIIKLDDGSISKIIDLVPDNKEDLNKIFVGFSLDEEESNKVLEIIKEFKWIKMKKINQNFLFTQIRARRIN